MAEKLDSKIILPGVREDVLAEGDTLRIQTTQDVRPHLAEMHRRRRDKTSKDTGLGRPALTIPVVEYERLIKANPALNPNTNAHEDVDRAWRKFMASVESKPWRNFDKI